MSGHVVLQWKGHYNDIDMNDGAKSEIRDDGKSEATDAASPAMEVDSSAAPSQTVPMPSEVVSATEAAPSSAEAVPSGTNHAMSVAPVVASDSATEVLQSPDPTVVEGDDFGVYSINF